MRDLIRKIPKAKSAEGHGSSVIEPLPNKQEALNSNPNTRWERKVFWRKLNSVLSIKLVN
jgi:hypothetical protein